MLIKSQFVFMTFISIRYTPKGLIDYSKLTGKCNIEIRNGFVDQEEFLRRYSTSEGIL